MPAEGRLWPSDDDDNDDVKPCSLLLHIPPITALPSPPFSSALQEFLFIRLLILLIIIFNEFSFTKQRKLRYAINWTKPNQFNAICFQYKSKWANSKFYLINSHIASFTYKKYPAHNYIFSCGENTKKCGCCCWFGNYTHIACSEQLLLWKGLLGWITRWWEDFTDLGDTHKIHVMMMGQVCCIVFFCGIDCNEGISRNRGSLLEWKLQELSPLIWFLLEKQRKSNRRPETRIIFHFWQFSTQMSR